MLVLILIIKFSLVASLHTTDHIQLNFKSILIQLKLAVSSSHIQNNNWRGRGRKHYNIIKIKMLSRLSGPGLEMMKYKFGKIVYKSCEEATPLHLSSVFHWTRYATKRFNVCLSDKLPLLSTSK